MGKVTGKGGKDVSKTGTRAAANVAGGAGPSGATDVLVKAGGADVSTAGGKKRKAKASATNDKSKGDPVSVISGQVVRDADDLALPGPIPIVWRRLYSSAMRDEPTIFGRGGWTHALEQWVAVEDGELTLRGEDGKNLVLPDVEPNGFAFHRGRRLVVRRDVKDRYEIESLDTRITRIFSSARRGARAVLREMFDRWGNRVELAYDDERLTRVRVGVRELRLSYDAHGRVLRVDAWADGAARQAIVYAYTKDGELARATDALGHAESYAYDPLRRLVKTTLKNGVSFEYAYDDELDRCVHTWGGPTGDLHDVEFTYDMKEGTTVTADHEVRKFTCNARGALVREETPDGAYAIEYEYDADNLVVAERNAAEEERRFERDARGNIVAETDPAGNVTRWEYRGDLPVRRITADGLVAETRYGPEGAPVEIVLPTGVRHQFAYDGAGRVSYVSMGDQSLATFEYDARGDRVRETDARGATTVFTYDPLGRPLTKTDALGRVTRVDYDALGRPVVVKRADGTRVELGYDALGNVARHTDAMGRVTTSEYAGTGVLVSRKLPDGQVWRLEYDGIERLTKITNPKRETYEYVYDRAGRVVEERTFDRRTLAYAYSRADRLQRIERPDGTWREFTYDALGNVAREDSSHGQEAYTRDAMGRLLDATVIEHNGKTVVTFERDAFGRVIAEAQNGVAVRSTYDARGRRVSRALPAGEVTRFAYDRAGVVAEIEHGGQTVKFERDALGRETRRRAARGNVDVASTWDAMDQLETRVATSAARAGNVAHRVLSQRRWSYDPCGRVVGISDARWGTTRYGYDPIGEIIEAHHGARHEVFRYDGAGSVVAAFESLERAQSWTVREGNLLTQTEDLDFEYDACARRTRRVRRPKGEKAKEETKYFWDCRDRLREVHLASGVRVLYTYDAFGRRVRKEIVPPENEGAEPERVRVVQFSWDGAVLAQEIDTERGKRVFVHAPESLVPVLQEERGEVFTYVVDQVGGPKELINTAGRVAWSAATSTWGRVREVARDEGVPTVESPFRLLGQYADEETGLCYTRFRYFDAEHARWISPDPLGIRGGPNLSGFDGSPTNDMDPFGLCKEADAKDPAKPKTLYHYTNEAGKKAILESQELNPSLKANNPKDARYGDGQYLSDIVPGTRTSSELSRDFLGVPYQGQRFTSYVEIDVTGLDVRKGRDGVFLIPNSEPLDLTGRIRSSGSVP